MQQRFQRSDPESGRRAWSGIHTVLAVLLLVWSPSGMSATWHSLAAAVGFTGSQAVFSLAGTPEVTDYSEVGLTLRQWLVADVFSLGVRGGYLNVTQDTNPAIHGASLSGAYGGLDAGLRLVWSRWFGFAAYGSETYHRATAQFAGNPQRIRWYGFHARLGPVVHIGIMTIGLGAFYRRANGEMLTASSSSTLFANQSGPYASLTLATGSRGSVRLMGEGGRWHTYLLSFRYGF
ncbi:MAG: hypothetical protein ACYCS1_10140 [Gammaproteobacteria bacterium]